MSCFEAIIQLNWIEYECRGLSFVACGRKTSERRSLHSHFNNCTIENSSTAKYLIRHAACGMADSSAVLGALATREEPNLGG